MRHRVIEAVLNETLGLHNKPKAPVHLVHKLTGPKKKEEKKKRRRRRRRKKKKRKKRRRKKKRKKKTKRKKRRCFLDRQLVCISSLFSVGMEIFTHREQ